MDINSAGDLKVFINELIYENEGKDVCSLDEYLRSILGVIYKFRDSKPDYQMIGQILKDSLTSQPLNYDRSWEAYKEPPFINCEPNPDDYENSLIDPDTKRVVTKFEVLEKTLFFQICDLKYINQLISSGSSLEQINDTFEEAGEGKLEDNRWGNLDVISYLESTINGLSNGLNDDNEIECDWLVFVDMLEYGRTYTLIDE